MSDLFAGVRYEPQHELRTVVEAQGYNLQDVKEIVIDHQHLDHAGGLDEFFDRSDVEVWVHGRELRSAF